MDIRLQITERIKVVRDHFFNGNTNKMAKAIGVDESRIRAYVKKNIEKRSIPNFDFVVMMIEKVPVNARWFLTGEGDIEQDKTPEFLLKRLEEFTIENYELRKEIERLTTEKGNE